MNRFIVSIILSGILFSSAISNADWPMPMLNSQQVTWRGDVTVCADVTKTPAWRVGEDVVGTVPPCIVDNIVYTVNQTGEDWYITEDESCWIEARDKFSGSLKWKSVDLDPYVSVSYSSVSGLTVDTAANCLYYATGQTLYSLALETGAINWQASIADAVAKLNISGISTIVCNASPAFNASDVYINTYDYSSTATALLAFDKSNGSDVWQVAGAGMGLTSPLAVTVDSKDVVIIPYAPSDGQKGGMKSYDAQTGVLIWQSEWTTDDQFFAELTMANEKIFGVTYNFSTEYADCVCVDANTGGLVWKVAALSADTAPLVCDEKLFIIGGKFGRAKLQGLSLSDGSSLFAPVALNASVFRNRMTASADHIYFTYQKTDELYNTYGYLVSYDFSGNKSAESVASHYNASTVLDTDGSLYVTSTDYGASPQKQELVKFAIGSSVDDWADLQ